jgi:hypothetical protein
MENNEGVTTYEFHTISHQCSPREFVICGAIKKKCDVSNKLVLHPQADTVKSVKYTKLRASQAIREHIF